MEGLGRDLPPLCLPPLTLTRGVWKRVNTAKVPFWKRKKNAGGDLCWFTHSKNKCSFFYFSCEDQYLVAPAVSFNRNSSVIILNWGRDKLFNVVSRFVPQTWNLLFFFFNVIAYFHFPTTQMTTQKRNKGNRTWNRVKVSLTNAVIRFTGHIYTTLKKTISVQVLHNAMQCKYFYKNACFDFITNITIQSHSGY